MKLVILSFMLMVFYSHSHASGLETKSGFTISVRYSIMAGSDEVERNKRFAMKEAWRQAEERCDEQSLNPKEIEPVEPVSYPIADTYHKVVGKFLCD